MGTIGRQIRGCFQESRPSVQCIFLMRYLAGVFLGGGPGLILHPWRVATGAAGWLCGTIAVYVFNGITDRVEDVGNGSTRPIAAGRLSVPFAAGATVVLTLVSLACELPLGRWVVLLTVAYLLVGYAYSGPPFPLKSTFYTCTAGGITLGVATYLAGFLAGGHRTGVTLTVFGGVMSLWMGGVGGIAKELSDVNGDRLAGRRTWPIILGEQHARRLLAAAAIGVGTIFLVLADEFAASLFWCALTVLAGSFVVAFAGLRPQRADRRHRRLPYRAFMTTQHLAHVALAVAVLSIWVH